MEFAQLTPGPGFMPWHGFMYYTQRVVTPRRLRRSIVRGLAHVIDRRHGRVAGATPLRPEQARILDGLYRHGYVPLPPPLENHQIADIHRYLADKPLSARRGHNGARFLREKRPAAVEIADYDLQDVVAAPHIMALANRPIFLRLASGYIGCKPTLSSLVLRWSFPRQGEGHGVQAFHRDGDDWRHVKIFVYLTDVDELAGPHVYVKGTHTDRASLRLRAYSDGEIAERYARDDIVTVTGPAGFGFAGDTSGIHKGTIPDQRARLMLQVQYSLLPSYIYRYRPVRYDGPLTLDPYINRLIVRFDGRL